MSYKRNETHALAEVMWQSEQELGKVMPPPNSKSFAALALFPEGEFPDPFTVIFYYEDAQPQQTAELHFLASELILPFLRVGSRLTVTDGFKTLANVNILRIGQ